MAAILNVHYQDMKEEVLEQAKAVSYSQWARQHSQKTYLLTWSWWWQTILKTFEENREERIIANKIRQEFDKTYGKFMQQTTHRSFWEQPKHFWWVACNRHCSHSFRWVMELRRRKELRLARYPPDWGLSLLQLSWWDLNPALEVRLNAKAHSAALSSCNARFSKGNTASMNSL